MPDSISAPNRPPLRALGIAISAVFVGLAVGALTAALEIVIDWIQSGGISWTSTSSDSPLLRFGLAAVIGAALAGAAHWLVARFCREAAGSGVQEIEGALSGVRPLRWTRVLPVKFTSAALALGGGMALGREGPSVQMGGNAGEAFGRIFRLDAEARHVLVAAGAAAGLSAAFNAPLAGALFVLEEMRPHFRFGFVPFQGVLIASVSADVVVRAISGQAPVLDPGATVPPDLISLPAFLAFGVILGVVAIVFSKGILLVVDVSSKWTARKRLASAAIAGAAIAMLATHNPGYAGGGYRTIHEVLDLDLDAAALLLLFVVRMVMTIGSYGTGVAGGIFAPMLALGTIAGVLFGGFAIDSFGPSMPPGGVFAVAGMAALFSAVVRAPITGIVLTIEMTGELDLVLVLLVTCLAATHTAEVLGGHPIYETLLGRTLRSEDATAPPT